MLVSVPLKRIVGGPPTVRLEPLIVTTLSSLPAMGEIELMSGKTMKLLLVIYWPAGATTRTGPEIAPLGTIAVICVRELVTNGALTLPKNTFDTFKKFVPLMTTFVPARPVKGETFVTPGE